MKRCRRHSLFLPLAALLVTLPQAALAQAQHEGTAAAIFDHSEFDALLKAHVDENGWVDYAGLNKDAARLDHYIAALATAQLDRLGRDERLALLLNAYNAFTLRLILDYWDGGKLASIRDIPDGKRWKHERWKLAGKVVSLDQIENEWIRPKFAEPRIHFALVCAAVGCPPLAREAYAGSKLDAQLDRQARYVHSHATWCRFDAAKGQLGLTKLYDWYGDDFKKAAGSVLKFAARYNSGLAGALQSGKSPKVDWLDYDWSLNDVKNRRTR